MDISTLDGRGYAKFVVAGTYFLKKYRGVLNDLNVFPVPDGDTGTNMYLTVRSAALEASKVHSGNLAEVAAAAAQGSLMGARGNSGVIISQMLRGFAHHVRHRSEIDTFTLATAMREAVAAARAALLRPVEGTILSVAHAAAEAAYHQALHERDFYRLTNGVLKTAFEALERTPDQLPVLKEAGVVDSGGAGFVYFLEGILRFLPEVKVRTTAFPRRPIRKAVFSAQQVVGENKFCTEFILQDATCDVTTLRDALQMRGDSLIVAGGQPTIKVHIHTDKPEAVQAIAAKFGTLTRLKVDNMEQQHNVLVVDKPQKVFSIVAVVPGLGFDAICKELGAEVTVLAKGNPSVRDLLLATNKCLSDDVFLFTNDSNVALAASEVAKMTDKRVQIIPTKDMVAGISGLLAFRGRETAPTVEELEALSQASGQPRAGSIFIAGKDATLGGVSVSRGKPAAAFNGQLFAGGSILETSRAVVDAMGARSGGLVTLYYGGAQKERDAQHLSEQLRSAFPQADVEYYFGGQKNEEYVVSFDE
ncbi:MAG: DAK2 domain-containing protein [Candidatus Eremiobacteraeota bacterium]|nr:DAK2 domain-containing protein [Candidatus Eremiobacteraeota bacterium]